MTVFVEDHDLPRRPVGDDDQEQAEVVTLLVSDREVVDRSPDDVSTGLSEIHPFGRRGDDARDEPPRYPVVRLAAPRTGRRFREAGRAAVIPFRHAETETTPRSGPT